MLEAQAQSSCKHHHKAPALKFYGGGVMQRFCFSDAVPCNASFVSFKEDIQF